MLGILAVSKADSSPCLHGVYVLVGERHFTEKSDTAVAMTQGEKSSREVGGWRWWPSEIR